MYTLTTSRQVEDFPDCAFHHFFQNSVSKGYWLQNSGIELHYAYVLNANARANIVISPGRAESAYKYAELIFDLYQNGYSVFVVDHQGQGKSTRLLNNPHIGYVSEFNNYIEDLHALVNHVFDAILLESKQNMLPKYLLCHSMGGAIGTGFVQKYPEVFSKLVLSAPMFGINAPLPESLMKFILKIVLRIRAIFKLSTRYVWGQSDYQAYPFEKNRLTNSKERYTAFKQIYAEDPSLQLGGPSFEWLSQAVIFMQQIRQNMASIKIPVCAFIAEEEQIVDNKEIQKAVSAVANHQLHYIENAKHEILFEKDKPRNQTLNTIFDFFSQ